MKIYWGVVMIWFSGVLLVSQDVALAQMQGMDMQQQPGHGAPSHSGTAMPAGMHHEPPTGAAVSYAELKDTVTELDAARRGTEKYKDVRLAEADGYRAYGPDVPGMGIHYVREHGNDGFALERPGILLYEKDASVPGGLALVGVSYLFKAAEGSDGQPVNAPFPKGLAKWHRHENICVLPDRSTPPGLTEEQCAAKGGDFTAQTQWMVHAWIWKDSPLGVFSPTNPNVQ